MPWSRRRLAPSIMASWIALLALAAPRAGAAAGRRAGGELGGGALTARGSKDGFIVTRWTLADGLPQSSPNALAVASDGYVWVGTEQGLARFDGFGFTVWDTRHGLPGERVVGLLAAASGLWVATTPGGLSRFVDGRFVPILPDVPVRSLLETESGTVWLGAASGLYRVDGEAAVERVPVPQGVGAIRALLDDGDGAILVGHSEGLGRRAADGTWTQLPLGEVAPPVTGLGRTADALWVAARNGFWRLAAGSWRRMTEGSQINPGVAVDPTGDVWLWSADGGVRRWHEGEIRGVPELAGTDALVFVVLPDGASTVWLGIGGEGLLRMRRPLIRAVTVEDGLPARAVHGVLQDGRGRLWLGSLGAGLTRLDASGVRTFGYAEGLPDASVMSLAEDGEGRIWVGTVKGLAVQEGEGFRTVEALAALGLGSSLFSALYPESDGSLLLAAGGRVLRYRDARVEEIVGRVFEEGGIELLYRDRRGDLWIGGTGLCRSRGSELECFSQHDGLPGHLVRSAAETPRGELWLGTYGGGLCRLETGPSFRCISEEQGLPQRTVHNVLIDQLGWAWLPSNRGLGRARLEELERAFEDPTYSLRADVFGLEDGLPDLELNGGVPPPGVLLEDGRLALPTMRGLALVDPAAAARASAVAPIAHLESLVVDGRELGPGAERRLAAGSDRVTFRYTAIHPRAPSGVRFRYRLDGHDGAWLAAGGNRSVSYTGLAPGPYTFRVQASVGGSPWSREVSTRFELPPFFWQTPWFAVSVLGLVAGVLAFLYWLRVRRLLELERVRLRIASDLHDELSGELSGIALSSALARRQEYLEEPERRRLEQIESASRQVIGGLRDLVWAINPEHDSLAATVRRMRSITAQLLEGLEWSFEESWSSADRAVAMTARRDLYLILKEALTNVVRHAAASRVNVRLLRLDDRLRLEVEDDGAGFDPSAESSGSGLASMLRRSRHAGGALVVESAPGQGTRLHLDLPLAKVRRGGERSGRRT